MIVGSSSSAFWSSQRVGVDAYEILQFSTVMLLALCEKQGCRKYLDGTVLALLQWQPFMDAIPGAAFCEEKLEPMSTSCRLQCRLRTGTQGRTTRGHSP